MGSAKHQFLSQWNDYRDALFIEAENRMFDLRGLFECFRIICKTSKSNRFCMR